MAKYLSDVLARVRATANIDSNRINDERLTEIVNDAIAEITSSGRLRFAERTVPVTLTADQSTYNIVSADGPIEKPVLWTFVRSDTHETTEIKQTTIEGLRTFFVNPLDTSVRYPQRYAIWGETGGVLNVQVFPVPVVNVQTSFDLRIKFNELDFTTPTTQTNDVVTGAYEALTYLTLLLAAPYMENDDRIDTWDRSYTRAFGRLTRSHAHARYSGSAQRGMREPG